MSDFDFVSIKKGAHIHFIGIGGISMSGLAQILLKNGYNISGSDRSESHITKKLEDMGIKVFIGQKEENIKGADLFVYTAAMHGDNPEMQAAGNSGKPMITRAQCLGAVMKNFRESICVAGTHGKTTTTSILSHALIKCGIDPTISIGGELDLIGGNIRAGGNDLFLTEACEYSNSFLEFFPSVAVITNIEADHLDFFKDIDDIIESFGKFASLTKDKGCVIACAEDENIKKALADRGLKVITYGLSDSCGYYAEDIVFDRGCAAFDIYKAGEKITSVKLKVPGTHNVLNTLAAAAVCDYIGADMLAAVSGIEEFCGTKRRFERKGEYKGAVIIDDYAHHPTEIKATLNAAQRFDKNKLWCVFQPHTYSRTKSLWKEFTESFDNVDELILTHIYAAREKFDGETTAEKLAEDIAKRGIRTRYIDSFEDIAGLLKKEVSSGDMVFTMGAGDVCDIADLILK